MGHGFDRLRSGAASDLARENAPAAPCFQCGRRDWAGERHGLPGARQVVWQEMRVELGHAVMRVAENAGKKEKIRLTGEKMGRVRVP